MQAHPYVLLAFLVLFSACAGSPEVLSLPKREVQPLPALLDEELLREEELKREEEREELEEDPFEARKLEDGSWEMGDPDAPLILRVYTDYQCEYCSEFARRTESRILEEFVDQGLVRYQVAMFPLEKVHEHAVFAASAALCAGEQGKFFEMHRKLLGGYFDLGYWQYRKFADETGLDRSVFLECYRSERHVDTSRSQREEGRRRGVEAVPTLFIGERKVEGVYPFGDIRAWVQEALLGK